MSDDAPADAAEQPATEAVAAWSMARKRAIVAAGMMAQWQAEKDGGSATDTPPVLGLIARLAAAGAVSERRRAVTKVQALRRGNKSRAGEGKDKAEADPPPAAPAAADHGTCITCK